MVRKNIWYYFGPLNLLSRHVICLGEHSMCTCEECLCLCFGLECPVGYLLSPNGQMRLKTTVLFWIFCLDDLSSDAAAKSLQSCPTLCDPIDGSPPGSPVPGIFQARTLEWVAISFSSAWKWKVKVKSLSRVWLPATPWTAAYQAPPSMGFSTQEYWSGLPLPSLPLMLVGC